VEQLKLDKQNKKITEEQYSQKLNEIKGGKDTPTVIIKAMGTASYKNLVDALDEMQICNIGKYVIDNITPEDKAFIKSFEKVSGSSQKSAN
jgi:biopolymer transport protein ExbD